MRDTAHDQSSTLCGYPLPSTVPYSLSRSTEFAYLDSYFSYDILKSPPSTYRILRQTPSVSPRLKAAVTLSGGRQDPLSPAGSNTLSIMHTFYPSTHLLSQNLPEHWLGRTVPTLHGMHLEAAALPPWLPLEHHKIPYPCGVDGNPYRHCACTLNVIIPYPHLPQP